MLSLNIVVQSLTLVNGLLVNFLFPALFGLKPYGELLQALLGTFVIHRLIDTMAEPLIGLCDGNTILPTALTINAAMAVLLTMAAVWLLATSVDAILLASMVGTSTILLSLHRNRRLDMIAAILLASSTALIGLSLARRAALFSIELRDILLITNLVGIVIGSAQLAIVSRNRNPRGGKRLLPAALLRLAPGALASSLVSNFLGTILVFILSTTLPARELAIFRIFTAMVQASASVFPASLKALFVSFTDPDAAGRIEKILTTSFWLFSPAAVLAAIGSKWFPQWAVVLGGAAVAIPYFWALCLERYMQARCNRLRYRWLNVSLTAILIAASTKIENIAQGIVFYATAASIYCIALALMERRSLPALHLIAICALVSVAVLLTTTGRMHPILGALAITGVGFVLLPPDRSLVPVFLGRL